MRHALVAAVGASALAFVGFGLLGVALSPALDTPLPEAEAAAALAFTFDGQQDAWQDASGQIAHTWLYRQAYVAGYAPSETNPVRHAEQVLKVGWPFTVVRGFVRSAGPAVERTGVAWIADASGQPTRLLPMQPVWPGVVFYGLVGLMLAVAVSRARGDPGRTTAPPP